MGVAALPERKMSWGRLWSRQRGQDYMRVGKNEESEYSPETRIDSEDNITRDAPKRKRWRGYLTCGSIWGVTIL